MRDLSPTEKKVLYGLVSRPTLTDRALSDTIGVKRSTISAHKSQLYAESIIQKVYVPNLPALGCELLTARYGEFNPLDDLGARREWSTKFVEGHPSTFLNISTDRFRIALTSDRNFTELEAYFLDYEREYTKHDTYDLKANVPVYFPYKQASIHRFFNYAPLLADYAGMRHETQPEPQYFSGSEPVDLSDSEKKVLLAVLKEPQASTKDIGKKVSLSQEHVIRIRNSLLDANIIAPLVIPDPAKLGLDILAFAYSRFNIQNKKHHNPKALLERNAVVTLLETEKEQVMYTVHPTYSDCQKTYGDILRNYKDNNLLLGDMQLLILHTGELLIAKHHTYAPLAEKLLKTT